MMNPWIILGAVTAMIIALAGAAYEGHSIGVNSQKAADQKQFDDINNRLAAQKVEANGLYRKQQDENLIVMTERDKLKNQLGEQDAKNRKSVLVLNANLATAKLQFRTSQTTGCGNGGGSAVGSGGNSASTQSTSVVQLPDKVTSDLRQFALDADLLAADYKLCYGYATKVK